MSGPSEAVGKASPASNVALLPIDRIEEHPDNPREVSWELRSLTASIRRHGVLQPCIVRPIAGTAKFQLIAGHRRRRAALKAGFKGLPCIVREIADDDVWPIQLSENVQQSALNPIEEARALQRLRDKKLTILDIANRLGVSEQRVSRRLGLLLLPEVDQDAVLSGELTLTAAWELLQETQPRPRGPRPKSGGRTTRYDPHFNQQHELAKDAGSLCDHGGHPVKGRLGPACGQCWEEVIRDHQSDINWDEWMTVATDDPTPSAEKTV